MKKSLSTSKNISSIKCEIKEMDAEFDLIIDPKKKKIVRCKGWAVVDMDGHTRIQRFAPSYPKKFFDALELHGIVLINRKK